MSRTYYDNSAELKGRTKGHEFGKRGVRCLKCGHTYAEVLVFGWKCVEA